MKKKSQHRKAENGSRSFTEIMNASVGVIGILLGSIAVIPTILNWIQSPRIEVIRQTVHEVSDRIIIEYEVKNSGSAIASDIFLQLQTHKNDSVYLPFSVAYEMRHSGLDWEISFKSLAPGESTGITIFCKHTRDFDIDEKILGRLPNVAPVTWIDYREGGRQDVIMDDSEKLKEWSKTRYSEKKMQTHLP